MTTHPTPAASNRIVVGIDGSPSSEAALRWAMTLSKATGGQIDALTTWRIPITYGWALRTAGFEKEARALLTNTVDAVCGAKRPHGLRLIAEEGNPARVLLEHSVGAQLLVVGSRGLGGFAGLMLGSVSAACAEHARCPVLVVHGQPAIDTP